jgi:hypothetical protein
VGQCTVSNKTASLMKPNPFPYPRTLMAACICVSIAWGAVGIILICILVANISSSEEGLRIPALVCILVLILAGIVYLPLSLSLKCPSCARRFLYQNDETKHANARTKWKMDYWAYVVIDVLFRRSFVCMYCGSESFVYNGKSTPDREEHI